MENFNDELMYDMLRSLRLNIAREQQVSAFMIFTNAVLDELVKYRPQTLEKIRAYTDLGETRIQKYGDRIIDVIQNGYPIIELPKKEKSEKEKNEEDLLIKKVNEQKLLVFPYLWELCSCLLVDLDDRTQEIIKMFVEGVDREEIAQKMDLSSERIRQLLLKGLENLKLTSAPAYKCLERENEELRLQLDEYKNKLKVQVANLEKENTLEFNNAYLKDLGISVRLENVVEKIGVKTVYQLSLLTVRQFKKIPNVGKKCIQEAKDLLESRGLSFQPEGKEVVEIHVPKKPSKQVQTPELDQEFDYFNKGKSWSEEDISMIEQRFEAGDDMVALIRALGRTPNAIMAKLKSLGYDIEWEKIGDPTVLPENRTKL